MPIIKAQNLDFSNKKIKMIIAGYAGIGKTTLALSTPKPLLIDVENGIDRVENMHRKDTIQFESYEQLLNDLQNENFSSYETFVIDTGGKLLDAMKPYVIKQNQQNGQRDGSLSMKGWGAVAQEFKRFMNIIDELKKHTIYIFHTKEELDGDMVKLRIQIEGSIKTKIWEDMDLGGFVEIQGKKRYIGFSNTERYYAKGSHAINGTYEIPVLKENDQNNFLSILFEQYIQTLNEKSSIIDKETNIYNEIMSFKSTIEKIENVEQLNVVLKAIQKIKHVSTTEHELKTHLFNKSKTLGFTYDKEKQAFI